MIDALQVRRMTPHDEARTLRISVDGISAIALGHAYARVVAAQDEIVTILDYLCREKHLTPDQVIGFDDERGELIVRP